MVQPPTGAVTFLFTDIEGSTQAWENDPTGMAAELEMHDRLLRRVIDTHGGFVFATGGDSFSAAFSSPTSALSAAADAQRGLVESGCGLRVRMGVHSGEAAERDGNYFGPPLNQTARLMSIGHGGQVLVSNITKSLVASADLEFLDLGEHRLADLSKPVGVTQLVADGLETEFAPLRSAVATDNLPMLGEVFGRSTDIDRIADLLTERRLVTLTGAGGIGKTTLATSVAIQMTEPFPDGRWVVNLTDLPPGSDQAAIAGAVAGVDDRFESVQALAPRRMLMILDNCEHVLDGASNYLQELFGTAPDVTVLATSRESLGLRGEKVIPVAPLSVDEDSEHASAVDLFIERAQEAGVALDLESDGDTITSICREVGGLPLAIELAAARIAVMTPTEILDRLSDRLSMLKGGRDGPEHHRTIEATIAWSYDLLDPDTQKLLRLLSVFEGGFDLEQAEAVGGADAVDRLTDLVRKSLVQRHDDRFSMLEAVRQYATARLQDVAEEDEARRQHFEYFADWAHEVYHRKERIRLTPTESLWATTNLSNLHAAIEWGATHDRPTPSAEIGVVLWHHYIAALYGKPTVDWFEPLLDHLNDLDPALQMGVLHGSAIIADWHFGDEARYEQFLLAEHEIYEQTGLVPPTGGTAHNGLAIFASSRGDWNGAIRWFREGIKALGDEGKAILSNNLARTLFDIHGDAQQALDILEGAEALIHLTTPWQAASNTLLQGEMHWRLGNHERARTLISGLLPTLRQSHMRADLLVIALNGLARVEQDLGNPETAASQYLEAIDIESTHGLVDSMWHSWESIHIAHLLLDLDEPAVADRIVEAYKTSPGVIPPNHQKDLEAVEADIRTALHGRHTPPEHTPLIDAIRQALTSHTTS